MEDASVALDKKSRRQSGRLILLYNTAAATKNSQNGKIQHTHMPEVWAIVIDESTSRL